MQLAMKDSLHCTYKSHIMDYVRGKPSFFETMVSKIHGTCDRPTYKMLADGLTKVLEGKEFTSFHNNLLGMEMIRQPVDVGFSVPQYQLTYLALSRSALQ